MKIKKQSVQVLRALGFLSVYLYHAGLIPSGGGWGGSIFFSLSGFLLMIRNYHREMSVSFFQNLWWACGKICRLYPLHIFMSVVALPLLVNRYIGRPHFGINVGLRVVVNFLLIQSWFPWESVRYSMNNLSWFLSCQFFLYFIFPVIHQCVRKLNTNKKIIGVIVVTWIIMWGYCWTASTVCEIHEIKDATLQGITYNFPLYRVGDFLIGSLFGVLYVKKGENKYSSNIYVILEGVAITVFVIAAVIDWESLFYANNKGYTWWMDAIYIFPAMYVIWNFYNNTGGGNVGPLARTPLTWLGDISGQGYLIHEIVLIYLGIIMKRLFEINISVAWKIVRAGFGLAITLIISWNWIKLQEKFCQYK